MLTTQDLFAAEGTLKKVTLRNGSATVVFADIAEANAAYTKYNGVTLDSMPPLAGAGMR